MYILVNDGRVTAMSPACNSARYRDGALCFNGPCIDNPLFLECLALPPGCETGSHFALYNDEAVTQDIEAHIGALYTQSAALQADIDEKLDTIAGLESRIAELQSSITELEAELADMQEALGVLEIVPEEEAAEVENHG